MRLVEFLNKSSFDFNPDEISDFNVEGISYDSRKIKSNFIFFAIKGFKEDGNKYIDKAIENGARIVFTEFDVRNLNKKYTTSIYFKST